MPCQRCHDIEVTDGWVRSTRDREPCREGGASIDELLDRAVAALTRGDRAAATAFAGPAMVLADPPLACTRCGRQTFDLVSEGLGNNDIATRLFVSPLTMQTYLSQFYTKLGFTLRAARSRSSPPQLTSGCPSLFARSAYR
jgi:DNA-binding CsgD family transcriptional regulator